MRIMNVRWPNNVDELYWDMCAHVDGQTYRFAYERFGQCPRWLKRTRYTETIKGKNGVTDTKAEFVNALREFANYIEKSAEFKDADAHANGFSPAAVVHGLTPVRRIPRRGDKKDET